MIITWMSNLRDVHAMLRDSIVRLHRRRAYAPTSNTASHDNHEKINPWVSLCFPYGYGPPLGTALRCSSAIRRWGRGRKETLAAKHCHFENHPLGLSCLTDFTLSSSIQVAFVILVLARFEILDHLIFPSDKNHTIYITLCARKAFFVF